MSSHKAEIYYYDIGDYLSREQKLNIISQFKSMQNLPFTRLIPNKHGDWISKRNDRFGTWIAIGDKENKNNTNTFFVAHYSNGIKTNRDSWCYNSNKTILTSNIKKSIEFYNSEVERFIKAKAENAELVATDFITYDSTRFAWDWAQKENDLPKGRKYDFKNESVRLAMYRPFFKQFVYANRYLNNRVYQIPQLFPTTDQINLVICTKGVGDKDFSCLISNCIPDLQVNFNGQCFPLYWYETVEPDQHSLFGNDEKIIQHEAISNFILDRAQSKYGNQVQKEDIFYYVYGILHSKSYRNTFRDDLKKMLPRIPLVSDFQKFWDFSKAGRALAELHLNYESVEPYPDVKVESLRQVQYNIPQQDCETDNRSIIAADNLDSEKLGIFNEQDDYGFYAVEKMRFAKKGEKGTIIYNRQHTITNVPEKAYEYVVNGKSAIEWIMERYAVTTDKKSGITNNPNDWSREHRKPRYIMDLLLSIINVSVQTVDIVNGLPEVDWEKE